MSQDKKASLLDEVFRYGNREFENRHFPSLEWDHEPAVRKRLHELVDAKCNRDTMDAFLIVLKTLSIGFRDKTGSLPLGMTLRDLRKLASDIEHTANEIDRVNRHPLFDPLRWISPRPASNLHPLQQRDFVSLAQVMRMYAIYLEWRTNTVAKFRRGYGRKTFEKLYLIRLFMKYVRETTGQPHYEALADLLSATLAEEPTWTADALRKLDSRGTTAQQDPKPPRR